MMSNVSLQAAMIEAAVKAKLSANLGLNIGPFFLG